VRGAVLARRALAAGIVLGALVMPVVLVMAYGEWSAGERTWRGVLLFGAICAQILAQALSAGDAWRGEMTFPVWRGRVQLLLTLAGFVMLMVWGVTVDPR
jgi:hypothetical protein